MSPQTAQRGELPHLPKTIAVCLFDLDGVLTQTIKLHAAAWKEMFDAFLRTRAHASASPFVPFDLDDDYAMYVDGKKRNDGARSFLRSRGIELPEGKDDDPPHLDTVAGLGNRKNELELALMERDGVEVYEGSLLFLRAVRAAGLRCGVVSSSANCREVLERAGIASLFETRVDAHVAAREHLAGKPAPDMFIAAAKRLGADPSRAAVFEDAIAGVEAGRAGRFALVVGVDRIGQAKRLRSHGADIVVKDLTELVEAD